MATAETERKLPENPLAPQVSEVTNVIGKRYTLAQRQAHYSLMGKNATAGELMQSAIYAAATAIQEMGATPLVITVYWGVGNSEWFANMPQVEELADATREACKNLDVSWGAGETQVLTKIIKEGEIHLVASCVGVIKPEHS